MNILCTVGKKPDIGQLSLLKYKKGSEKITVKIIHKASHKWQEIAKALAPSDTNLVSNLSGKFRDNQEECLSAVFVENFLNNKPKNYNNDWDGLIELLDDVDLSELSKDVKKVVLLALS